MRDLEAETTWGPADWLRVAHERLHAEACTGWLQHGRCVDRAGRRLADPHDTCLRAQYRHDVVVLEHGPLGLGGPLGSLARPA